MSELERVADELARTAGEGTDARALARVGRTVVTSARRAGAGAVAVARAWAERRGVTVMKLAEPAGLAAIVGQTTRREVARVVRRRLLRRMGRNLTALAPLLAGAVAGAEVNRRATLSLGEAVIR